MNYSDTTSALVINKLTKSQYETLKASGSLQSNQIYITPETLPSNLGDFNNDVGYVTASAVAASYATKGEVEVVTASVEALASSVDAVSSQVSAMASSLSAKRDYDDLTYGGIYDPTDAEGYYGITSWHIEGYKYNGQTIPAFNTATRGKNNPTYGTFWNNGGQVIYTSDFSTFNLDGFGNAQPVPFTLSLDKTTYDVSFMGTEQQDIILTANCVNQDRLALNSQLSAYATQAYVNAQIGAMASSVSALTSSISAKRDYTDLTYNTTVPSETIDNSNLVWDDQDPLYNAKLTFLVEDSVAGDENLSWDSNQTCWVDNQIGNFMVWYAAEWGADPSEGKFVLIDGSDVCLQFDLEDGVNVQTFNYTSENFESTGTLTMTFTGEPAHVVSDNLALDSNLNVSGIGCSTVLFSGTYSDSTSFAFNVVVQPSA